MNRPEGISPEAWCHALAASILVFDRLLDEGRIAVISVEARDEAAVPIARAIVAAQGAERLRNIGVALSFIRYGGDTHHGITENPMADVREVAAAIRTRAGA